jgi:hypothetical protein
MASQILDDAPAASSSAPESSAPVASSRKILIGGQAITDFICGKRDRKTVRWLYGQLGKLPVWQLEENGALYAYPDELTAHFEKKAAEAKAAQIAAAEAKAAEKEAIIKAAAVAASRKPSRSPPNRRRERPRLRADAPRASAEKVRRTK